jgi:carbon monoxide dehydrogenase subunit G
MIIESTPSSVNQPIHIVFDFLKNIENLNYLLPQDKISAWTATSTDCSFKIQGGIIIPLVLDNLQENKEINLVSGPKSPFPFTLSVKLTETEVGTKGQLFFDGKMSKTIQFLAEKPLKHLFNTMTENIKVHFEG